MYDSPIAERCQRPLGSKKAFASPRKRDWWTCMPLPFSPKIGLGMKVA